jgi:hypothetical protein
MHVPPDTGEWHSINAIGQTNDKAGLGLQIVHPAIHMEGQCAVGVADSYVQIDPGAGHTNKGTVREDAK